MDLDLEYGKILKDSRIEQGLSLEDISYDLKINLAILKRMEGSETTDLPKPPFTKNFLKTYCARLSISPDSVVELYEKSLGLSGASSKIKKGVLVEDTEPKDFFILDFIKDKFLPIAILVSTVLAVGAIVSILRGYNFEGSSEGSNAVAELQEKNDFEELKMTESSDVQPLEKSDSVEKVKASLEEVVVDPVKIKQETALIKGDELKEKSKKETVDVEENLPEKPIKVGEHTLVVEPLAKSALYIKADSDVRPVRASLKPDTPRKFNFDNAIIRFLDAGAVNVIFNNEDIGALGIFGEEKTIEFPSLKEL